MAKPEGLRVGGAGTVGTADNTQIKKPKKHRKAQNSVWSKFGEPLLGDQEIGAEYERLPRNPKELAS